MSVLQAELQPHPTSDRSSIRRFSAAVDPRNWPHELEIRLRVEGEMSRLRLPLPGLARRSDCLWQHTCFEAFLRADGCDAYHEFNFAPNGDWACYRFADRRRGRTSPELPYPPFAISRPTDCCEVIAFLPIAELPELAAATAIDVGLAAVLEAEDGALSYWALAHRGEMPDFHDPASFRLRVTPG